MRGTELQRVTCSFMSSLHAVSPRSRHAVSPRSVSTQQACWSEQKYLKLWWYVRSGLSGMAYDSKKTTPTMAKM